jgi:hypothetical protein
MVTPFVDMKTCTSTSIGLYIVILLSNSLDLADQITRGPEQPGKVFGCVAIGLVGLDGGLHGIELLGQDCKFVI